MKTYRVTWEIDIHADSPQEAARQAREIQLDPDNTADQFSVYEWDAPSSVVEVNALEE